MRYSHTVNQAAALVIAECGDGAFDQALARARKRLERGEMNEALTWVRIAIVIDDLRCEQVAPTLH